jgi:hypothetical protein
VPVRVLALAVIVAQIVAGGKARLHRNLVHSRCSLNAIGRSRLAFA